MELTHIFEPITINGLTIKNRMVVSAMASCYCSEDGMPTEKFMAYHERKARGGFGAIITEDFCVCPEAGAFKRLGGLWNDEQMKAYRAFTQRIHDAGAKIIVQLYHAGRQTSSRVTGVQCVAPSAIKDPTVGETPHALTVDEIHALEQRFVDAAVRAKAAGFDGVEIHGAHGYLINQFASPYSNKRSDEYGGTTVNRARFATEVIAAVRPSNVASISDTICQSRTRTYDDSRYHISPNITTIESLNNVVKVPGVHNFTNTLPGIDRHGCDSTVNFKLVVEPAPRRDTTVATTDLYHNGYAWHDSVYMQPGHYARFFTLSDGCDSLDVLHLVELILDSADIDFCIGDTTEMTVPAVEMKSVRTDSIIPRIILVGDVLCTDGSVMRPDAYLSSGKTAMGVVLSVDESSGYGRAIALSDVRALIWARNDYYSSIHSTPKTTFLEALLDIEGAKNTNEILRTARMASGTDNTVFYAPAAHYCKFYNHLTYNMGTNSLGWYLPAAGELQLIYSHRVELNKTLTLLSTQNYRTRPLYTGPYWSSTEYDNQKAWCLDNGLLSTSKTRNHDTRPVIQFPLP